MTHEWDTKVAELFEKAIHGIQIIDNKRINKSRVDFIVLAVSGLIQAKSVRFHEIADKMDTDCKEESNLRRIQNFMSDYDLDMEFVMMLILLLLPIKCKMRLSIDRTNWDFGGKSHNVLVVTAYTHGVGIPLWFECLDNKGGNSDSDDRIYVILCLLGVLDKKRIKCILGDCEFIGKEWISFLVREKIPFYFDIRTNQYFEHNGTSYQISKYMSKRGKEKYLSKVTIFGHQLSLAMKQMASKSKNEKKKLLAIVTSEKVNKALSNYKNRWSIEVLFQSLKGRGFNLESTHLKDGVRLRKLFALCAIGFTIVFLVGLSLAEKKPIPIKKHGYKSNSFFRHGLNFARKALKTNKKEYILFEIQESIYYVFEWLCNLINDNLRSFEKIVM